jgi:hypothetical protein
MYDLKNWFLIPPTSAGYKLPNGNLYGRETHHLEGLHLENNSKVYAYHYDTGKTMVFSKAPQKLKPTDPAPTVTWPWDLKGYDDKFIYDTATENGWKSDRDFKKQSVPVPMCPRFWDGNPTTYQFSLHMPYGVFVDGKQVGSGDVGPAYFTIEGPFKMDHSALLKGDVGVVDTILLSYYWTDRKNREQLFLCQEAGWDIWTHANLVQLSPNFSEYVVDMTSVHNKIVAGQLKPLSTALAIP